MNKLKKIISIKVKDMKRIFNFCFTKNVALKYILFLATPVFSANIQPELSIVTDRTPGIAVEHGLTKLTDALTTKKVSFEKVVSLQQARGKTIVVAGISSGVGEASKLLKVGNHQVPQMAEALTIWKTSWQKKPVWLISGFDDRGLMYGLLDVADRIGWSVNPNNLLSEVKEINEKPDVLERAISLYTMNRTYWESRFYDEAYWTRYLDILAQNRFNSMVVIFGYENGGFLAPCYPYFFDTEDFPDVKMVGISPQEQQRNLNALNKLIRMAHARGVKFSVGIWDHIYRGGVQAGGLAEMRNAPLKPVHGLVWGVNDSNLVTYNKAALAKFVKLVPELDGIQFRMHNESGLKKSEQDSFWADVFKTMKASSPNLRLDLRAKELPKSVIESAISSGINFRITTKYWMEQMGMPWHPTQINPEKSENRHSYGALLSYPQQYKMHWRLWNGGTSRILLWGDPEYVRRFAASSHLYNGDGYEVNEPLATKMEAQPHDAKPFDLLNQKYQYYDYEFERYWHFFQTFGRLGYNPQTSAEVWNNEFRQRFGAKAAPMIEKAMHKASWILPRIVASCYPYGRFPMTRGWAEKQNLGDLPAYAKNAGSDLRQFANFKEEANLLMDGGDIAKLLPSMNSLWFEQTANEITGFVTQAEKVIENKQNKEFYSTMTDLRILANLALYHSRRIPAAVSYNLFEKSNDVTLLDDAIAYERKAIDAWRQLVNAAGDVYANDLMMGVRTANLCGHWKDELINLEKGLKNLEKKRSEMNSDSIIAKVSHYKPAKTSTNEQFFKISHQPVTMAAVDSPITIRIKVNATSGVKIVRLLYRNVNQELEYKTLPMLTLEGNDNYEATIPVNQINPKWDMMYLIEIIDNKGRGIIYPDFNKETPYCIIKINR